MRALGRGRGATLALSKALESPARPLVDEAGRALQRLALSSLCSCAHIESTFITGSGNGG
jgi:hypothetical protein